jgi:hypothetical protein
MLEDSLGIFNKLIWKMNSRNMASLPELNSDQATDSLNSKIPKMLRKLSMQWTENHFKAQRLLLSGPVKTRKKIEEMVVEMVVEMAEVATQSKKSASTAERKVTGLMNVKKAAGKINATDVEVLDT